MLWLALSWLALAAIGFGLWNADVRGPGVVTMLIFAGVIAGVVLRRIVAAWEPDYIAIARDVERLHPDLHALLLTAVEQRPEDASGRLNFLQQRVVVHAAGEIRRRNCIDTVPGWQMAGATALQFATLALAGLAIFGLMKAPEKSAPLVAAKTGDGVTVTPGDVEIERGSGLVVLAKFESSVPSEAVLVLSPANEPAKRIPLVKNLDDPVFGGGIPEVQTDASYRVEYAGRATREFHVKVFEHPRLDRADARVRYPEFAKLPEKLIADTRRVSAVEGATLNVEFQLNKPVKSASLVSKDGSIVQLAVDPAKSVVELRDFPVRESHAWELKLQDADGRANKLTASFTLDALPNRRPQLKVITPKGDQRVSPIEEVAFRAEVWDDFGLAAAGIKYTIAGGRTEEVPLVRDSKPDERLNLEHVLKLEDIGVKVDELVSWHLWADDVGPDGKPRRTESDLFFAEVRPFEEIYRPGDESAGEQQQQQGGAGGEAAKLAELQKQIISATWNLKRAEDNNPSPSGPGEKYLKDEPIVKDSQAEALGMATKLAEKIEDPKSRGLIDNVTQEMDKALQQLVAAEKTTAPLPDALAAEQASYNALLKLAAHEFRVTRSQRQQGKGKGQQGDKNRAQLDELEMKEEKKRYETQSEAQAPQNEQQKEQLAVLNRLKELAQRQQDINERVKELQTAIQEAKTEKEREEAKRQLKRLREEEQQLLADLDELRQKLEKEQNQSRFAEERKQLEQTRNDAQQAAESMQKGESSRALAEGKRAEQSLQKMRDELRKRSSGQFKDEMRQMRADARDLAQRQQEIAEQLDAKPQGKERRTLDGSSPQEKLAQEFTKQQEGLEKLREKMQGVSEQAEVAEPLLARQLYDTLRDSTQAGTTDTLAKAGELARRGYGQQVKQFEEKARGEVEKVKSGVERAAESVLGDEAEALRQARAELDKLGQEVEREIANARPDLAENSGSQRGAGRQKDGKPSDSRGEREGSDPAGKDGDPSAQQPGEKGEGRKGEGKDGQGAESSKSQGKGGDPKGEGKEGQDGKGESQQGEGKSGKGEGKKGEQGGDQKGESQQGEGKEGTAQKGEGQQGKGEGEGEGKGGKREGKGQGGGEGQSQGGEGKGSGKGQQPGGKGSGSGEGEGASQEPGQGAQSASGKSSGKGSGSGEGGEGKAQGDQEANADGKATRSRLAEMTGAPRQRGGIRTGGSEGGGMWGGATDGEQAGPITGDGFVEWSDRLRNVEEMLDSPELRREAAQIREAAKVMRAEFKRHSEQPKWDIVKVQVGKPLTELRDRVSEELARRESKEALVPIDRDPVPTKYSDRVRRYYEELGRSR
jgi:hypothetical protein